jgi:predicted RNA-binding Zn-ribbon protein involved in translation (DUF1610 family)
MYVVIERKWGLSLSRETRLEAECPECGEHLCVSVDRDRKSGKLKIVFWCEGAGDDAFEFEILTGLKNKDLKELRDVGKIVWRKMAVRLIAREPDPYR